MMEIIATTDEGFLIKGTESEVKEILRAVNGTTPESITIGQCIPAIDYASTITKLKALPDNHTYKTLIREDPTMNQDDVAEKIGRISGRLDNLCYHVTAVRDSIAEIRDELRAAYVDMTGENPWAA